MKTEKPKSQDFRDAMQRVRDKLKKLSPKERKALLKAVRELD